MIRKLALPIIALLFVSLVVIVFVVFLQLSAILERTLSTQLGRRVTIDSVRPVLATPELALGIRLKGVTVEPGGTNPSLPLSLKLKADFIDVVPVWSTLFHGEFVVDEATLGHPKVSIRLSELKSSGAGKEHSKNLPLKRLRLEGAELDLSDLAEQKSVWLTKIGPLIACSKLSVVLNFHRESIDAEIGSLTCPDLVFVQGNGLYRMTSSEIEGEVAATLDLSLVEKLSLVQPQLPLSYFAGKIKVELKTKSRLKDLTEDPLRQLSAQVGAKDLWFHGRGVTPAPLQLSAVVAANRLTVNDLSLQSVRSQLRLSGEWDILAAQGNIHFDGRLELEELASYLELAGVPAWRLRNEASGTSQLRGTMIIKGILPKPQWIINSSIDLSETQATRFPSFNELPLAEKRMEVTVDEKDGRSALSVSTPSLNLSATSDATGMFAKLESSLPFLDGKVNVDKAKDGFVTVDLNLRKLALDRLLPTSSSSTPHAEVSSTPARIPIGKWNVQSLSLGPVKDLQLMAEAVADGDEAKISELRIKHKNLLIVGREGHISLQKNGPVMVVSGHANLDNLQEYLAAFSLNQEALSGRVFANWTLNVPLSGDSKSGFDMETRLLASDLCVTAGSRGLRTLLSLLAMNFSDAYRSAICFARVSSQVKVANRAVRLTDSSARGGSLELSSRQLEVNLAEKKIDGDLSATPNLDQTAAMISKAGGTVSPVVRGVIKAGYSILRTSLRKGTTFKFRLSGPIDNIVFAESL